MYRLFAVLSLLTLCAITPPSILPAAAQTDRVAEKSAVGKTIHFTLEAGENKDIAIALPKGEYVIQADLQLVGEKSTNMQMQVDLLKTNGVMVESRVLIANEIHRVARVAKALRLAKPLGARLRITNDDEPMEFWVTVYPKATRRFEPFAFAGGEVKELGIGEANGKGGTLAEEPKDGFYAFHKIALPAGKYDISLYLKQVSKDNSNLQGTVRLLDKFGVPLEDDWLLSVNEIDTEARKDKRLVLVKPAVVYFMVTDTNTSKAYDYTVGIEKATD